MSKLTTTCIALIFFACHEQMQAQVKIMSSFINPASVYPESLTQLNVLNQGAQDEEVFIEAYISSASNENIITVQTNNFILKPGVNSISGLRPGFSSVSYSSGEHGKFLSTYHYLSAGNYRFCARLLAMTNKEVEDEYCDELEATSDLVFNLVFPFDGDTVLTSNPLLVWVHSESFINQQNPNDYYRMVVSEVKSEQSSNEAMLLNNPDWLKEYLTSHNIQYPFEAKKLEKGKWYAWQVQRVVNFVVTNSTETWKFFVKDDTPPVSNKYAVLKSQADAGYFVVTGNTLYFKFDERYHSDQKLDCKIKGDKKQNEIQADARYDKKVIEVPPPNFKEAGDNRYEINLNGLPVNSGFYTLEVKNSKNEKFILKFLIAD